MDTLRSHISRIVGQKLFCATLFICAAHLLHKTPNRNDDSSFISAENNHLCHEKASRKAIDDIKFV